LHRRGCEIVLGRRDKENISKKMDNQHYPYKKQR